MDYTNMQFGIYLKCFPFMISNFNVCGCSKWTQNFNTDREYIDEYKKAKINNSDKKNNQIWIEKNNIKHKIESKKKKVIVLRLR